jgi:hypothetical protein
MIRIATSASWISTTPVLSMENVYILLGVPFLVLSILSHLLIGADLVHSNWHIPMSSMPSDEEHIIKHRRCTATDSPLHTALFGAWHSWMVSTRLWRGRNSGGAAFGTSGLLKRMSCTCLTTPTSAWVRRPIHVLPTRLKVSDNSNICGCHTVVGRLLLQKLK